jgi:ATP-dependent Lhr-like helicase
VDPDLYQALLRRMGAPELGLIEQAPDGLLLLGRQGEMLVDHYSFYAVFKTPEEFRIVVGSRTLGTVPVDSPLWIGALVIFAGRRWRVLEVLDRERIIMVEPATGARPPSFGGEWGGLAEPVVRRMRAA